jgi:monofunctional glycosyltransferase
MSTIWRVMKKMKLTVRRIAAFVLKSTLALIGISLLSVLLLRWIPPVASALMIEKRIDALIHNRDYKAEHQWVSLDRLPKSAALAVIAAEDQNFASHHGFDFQSIEKAIDAHERGKRLRGASTISQQTAKNLFLWSGRSFIRKGLEAYFTVLIELTWPKRRILEVYLNIIELGDGIYGVEAASRRYFGKPASKLTPQEAALLAAVLPNPIRLKASKPSAYVNERRDWILGQMSNLGGVEIINRF